MTDQNFFLRRTRLIEKLKATAETDFSILLFSGFSCDPRISFRVDNNFFYLTGHKEPNTAAIVNHDGQVTLFKPNSSVDATLWETADASAQPLYQIEPLGQKVAGYSLPVKFDNLAVENLIAKLQSVNEQPIFGVQNYQNPDAAGISVLWFFSRLKQLVPNLNITDTTSLLTELRQTKDEIEITATQAAVDACIKAHRQAMHFLRPNISENIIKSVIESQFDESGSNGLAFQSIVASGKNATVLHHTPSNYKIGAGELVVIDIGCQMELYSSDLTRTLPSSGKFSPRQRELYQLVLSIQKAVEQAAVNGSYLRNKSGLPSLHRLAVEMFTDAGYQDYFIHSIGHHMGLQVHDVANYDQPLQPGAIFTIEPGLYLPQEGIGIRIEDNYLMTPTGAQRLSAKLCREIDEIEGLMNAKTV